MTRSRARGAALLFAAVVLCAFAAEAANDRVTLRTIDGGEYVEYVPAGKAKGILVIAHGSVDEEQADDDLAKLARTYLGRWTAFADAHSLIAVAPVFGRDFGSWNGGPGVALGGYRGLEGKRIGADELVDRIVARYRRDLPADDRIYLYGHSAGGQFANRYAVRHPDRVKALVVSAAGRYAFPDPDAPWPYGEKAVTVKVNGIPQRTVNPDPAGWKKAAALPVTVVVGSADTAPQPPRSDHPGSTRVDYATHWVEAMRRLAPGGGSNIRVEIVPGIGHNSARLTPACQAAFARSL